MKFNKTQRVDFTSKLTDFEVMNSEFIRCRCYALASGDNANGSDITMGAIDKAIARGEFYNKPIVAHLYKDEDDNGKWRVGGHDSKWVISNTGIEVVNECIPFGTIPESASIRKEEVLEPDGITVNTYVVMDVILWVGRFNIMDAAYSDDVYFNQSCEITINDYHWKDNDILAIDDFTFSALCLLNKSDDPSKEVRPCFPSCRVEKMKSFSINESQFKQNFELMLDKLKQYETSGSSTVPNKKPNKEETKSMEFKKISDSLSSSEIGKSYRLLNVTDKKVYTLNMEDYKPYGFDYAIITEDDTEKVEIDYESKVEMSLSATDKITEDDFTEFDIKSEIETIKEEYATAKVKENSENLSKTLNEQFSKDYDELKESYEALEKSHNIISEKLAVFEKKEAEMKEEVHKKEIDDLVDSYAKKLGRYSSFLVYKAQIEDKYSKSVDEVEQDLILMAGKYLTSGEGQSKKTFSYNPTITGVGSNDTKKNEYGHWLDKYLN